MRQDLETVKEQLREAREQCVQYYEMWAEEVDRRDEKTNDLKRRIALLATALSTLKTVQEIDILCEDVSCAICLNAIEGQGIRMKRCAQSHQVCPECFGRMVAQTETIACPLCRTPWEEGNLLIE